MKRKRYVYFIKNDNKVVQVSTNEKDARYWTKDMSEDGTCSWCDRLPRELFEDIDLTDYSAVEEVFEEHANIVDQVCSKNWD